MQPTDRSFPAPTASASVAAPDDSPSFWVLRGILVGLTLGASAGSVYPIIGTGIGAVVGTVAGLAIGVATAIIALVTRYSFPAGPAAVQLRERIACVMVIWMPLLAFRDLAMLLAAPAVIGTIHALAAGTPARGALYSGNVSRARKMICKGLPLTMLTIIGVGWGVFTITNGR